MDSTTPSHAWDASRVPAEALTFTVTYSSDGSAWTDGAAAVAPDVDADAGHAIGVERVKP